MKCMPTAQQQDVSLDALLSGTAFQIPVNNVPAQANHAHTTSKGAHKLKAGAASPVQKPHVKFRQHILRKPGAAYNSPDHGSPRACLSPPDKLLRAARNLPSAEDEPSPSPSPRRHPGALPKPAAQQRRDAQQLLLPGRTQLAILCASNAADGVSQALSATAGAPDCLSPLGPSAHLARALHSTQEAFQFAIDDVYNTQRLRIENGLGLSRPAAGHQHPSPSLPTSPRPAHTDASSCAQHHAASQHRPTVSPVRLQQPASSEQLSCQPSFSIYASPPHQQPSHHYQHDVPPEPGQPIRSRSGSPARVSDPQHPAINQPERLRTAGLRYPAAGLQRPSTAPSAGRSASAQHPGRMHLSKVNPSFTQTLDPAVVLTAPALSTAHTTTVLQHSGPRAEASDTSPARSWQSASRSPRLQQLPGSYPSFEQVHVLLSSIQMPVPRSLQPSPSHGMPCPPQLRSPKPAATPPPTHTPGVRSAAVSPTKAAPSQLPADAHQRPHSTTSYTGLPSPGARLARSPAAPPLHTTHTSSSRADAALPHHTGAPAAAGAGAGQAGAEQVPGWLSVKHAGGLARSPGKDGRSWPHILHPHSGAALPCTASTPAAPAAGHQHRPGPALDAPAASLRLGVQLGAGTTTEQLVAQAAREQAVYGHLDFNQGCVVLELDGSCITSSTACLSPHKQPSTTAAPTTSKVMQLHRGEESHLPHSLLLLPPSLLRIKAVAALSREQCQAMAVQTNQLYQQLQAALKELHLTRALEVGNKLGMSKQQLRRLRAKVPEAGGSAFNLTLLRGVVHGCRLRLCFAVLQQLVTHRQQRALLVDHARGGMFSGQLSAFMGAWLEVAKQRGAVRQGIALHRQARLHRNLHLGFALWHVITQYNLSLDATLVAAQQARRRRIVRRCFTWWHTCTQYRASLLQCAHQLAAWHAARAVRAWREVVVQQGAKRHKMLIGLASHVRGMMTSALAHWRSYYLQSYMDKVWLRAVDSWRSIRLMGRVLAQWHFIARRAAQVIAKAAHPQGKTWQGAALQASPPLGLHGMWTAAQEVLSAAAFLIEAAGDEVRHLRRFYRFYTSPPPEPPPDLDITLAAGLPTSRPGGLLTALLDAAARATPCDAAGAGDPSAHTPRNLATTSPAQLKRAFPASTSPAPGPTSQKQQSPNVAQLPPASAPAPAAPPALPVQHLLLNQWQYKHEVEYLLHELHEVVAQKLRCTEAIRTETLKADDLAATLKERESALSSQLLSEQQRMAPDVQAVQNLNRLQQDIQELSVSLQQAERDAQAADALLQATAHERMRPQLEARAAHAAASAALEAARARTARAEEAVSAADTAELLGREELARAQQRLSEALHINSALAQTVREVAVLADQAPAYQAPRHLRALEEAQVQLSEAQHVVMLAQAEVSSREAQAAELARSGVCSQVDLQAARQAEQDAVQDAQQAALRANAASEAMEKRDDDSQMRVLRQLEQEAATAGAGAHAARLTLASAQHQLHACQVHCTPVVIQAVEVSLELQAHLTVELQQVHTDQQSLETLLSSRLLPLREALVEASAVELQLQQRLNAYPQALVDELSKRWAAAAAAQAGAQQQGSGDVPAGAAGDDGVSRLARAWMLGRDVLREAEEVDEPVFGGPPGSPKPWHFNPMGFQGLPFHTLHTSRDARAQRRSVDLSTSPGRGRAAGCRSPRGSTQHVLHGQGRRRSVSSSPTKHSDVLLRSTLLGRVHKHVAGAAGVHASPHRGSKDWAGQLRDWGDGHDTGIWYPPGAADRSPSRTRPGHVSPPRAQSPARDTHATWSVPAHHQGALRPRQPGIALSGLSLSAAAKRLVPLNTAVTRAGLPRLTLSDWSSETRSQVSEQLPGGSRGAAGNSRPFLPSGRVGPWASGHVGGSRAQQGGSYQSGQLPARHVTAAAAGLSAVRNGAQSQECDDGASTSTASLLRSFLNAHPPPAKRSPVRLQQSRALGVMRRLRPYAAALAAHPIRIRSPGSSPARTTAGVPLNGQAPITEAGNRNDAYPINLCAENCLKPSVAVATAAERQMDGVACGGDVVGAVSNAGGSSVNMSEVKQMSDLSERSDDLRCGFSELESALEAALKQHQQAARRKQSEQGNRAAGEGLAQQQHMKHKQGVLSVYRYLPDGPVAANPPSFVTQLGPSAWHYMNALAPDLLTGMSVMSVASLDADVDASCQVSDSSLSGWQGPVLPQACRWCPPPEAGDVATGSWPEAASPFDDTSASVAAGLPRLSRMQAGVLVYRARVVLSKVVQGWRAQVAAATVLMHEAFHRGHRSVQSWVLHTWHQHAHTVHVELQLLGHVAVCGQCWARWRRWASRRALVWRLLTAHTQYVCLSLMHKALMGLKAAVQHKVFRQSCILSGRQSAARRALRFWRSKVLSRHLIGRVLAVADELWEARDSSLLYGLQFKMLQHVFDRWIDFTAYKQEKHYERALEASAAAHHTTLMLVRCMRHWRWAVALGQEHRQLLAVCVQLLQEWKQLASDAAQCQGSRYAIRQLLRHQGYASELAVWRHRLLIRSFIAWAGPWTCARDHRQAVRQAAVMCEWREQVLRSRWRTSKAATQYQSLLLRKALARWRHWQTAQLVARHANATAVIHRVGVLRRNALAGLRVRHAFENAEDDERDSCHEQGQLHTTSHSQGVSDAGSCQAGAGDGAASVQPSRRAHDASPAAAPRVDQQAASSATRGTTDAAAGAGRECTLNDGDFYQHLLRQAHQQADLISQQVAAAVRRHSPARPRPAAGQHALQSQVDSSPGSIVFSLADLSVAHSKLEFEREHASGRAAPGGSGITPSPVHHWPAADRTDVAVLSCDAGLVGGGAGDASAGQGDPGLPATLPQQVREAAMLELCVEWRRLWVLRGALLTWLYVTQAHKVPRAGGGMAAAGSGTPAAGPVKVALSAGGSRGSLAGSRQAGSAGGRQERHTRMQQWVRPAPVICLPQPAQEQPVCQPPARKQAAGKTGSSKPGRKVKAGRKQASKVGPRAHPEACDTRADGRTARGHTASHLQALLVDAAARNRTACEGGTEAVVPGGPTCISILAGAASASVAAPVGVAGARKGLAAGLWGSPIHSGGAGSASGSAACFTQTGLPETQAAAAEALCLPCGLVA